MSKQTTTTITVDYVSNSTFLGYIPAGTGTSSSCNSTTTTSAPRRPPTTLLPSESDASDKTLPPVHTTVTTTHATTFDGFPAGATQTIGSSAGKAVAIGETKYVVACAAGMAACGVLALFL
jgi:hypothetical protein